MTDHFKMLVLLQLSIRSEPQKKEATSILCNDLLRLINFSPSRKLCSSYIGIPMYTENPDP